MHSHCNRFDSEDGASMFLRNVVIHLQNYMTLQLQMTESEHLHLWKTCKLMCDAGFVLLTVVTVSVFLTLFEFLRSAVSHLYI
jgi:hypothetical protein